MTILLIFHNWTEQMVLSIPTRNPGKEKLAIQIGSHHRIFQVHGQSIRCQGQWSSNEQMGRHDERAKFPESQANVRKSAKYECDRNDLLICLFPWVRQNNKKRPIVSDFRANFNYVAKRFHWKLYKSKSSDLSVSYKPTCLVESPTSH